MVNIILTKWPHFKKEFVSEADAFDLWKYRLRTYFKLILKIQEEEHITYQKFSIGRKEKGRKEVKITERSKNHKRKEKQYFN